MKKIIIVLTAALLMIFMTSAFASAEGNGKITDHILKYNDFKEHKGLKKTIHLDSVDDNLKIDDAPMLEILRDALLNKKTSITFSPVSIAEMYQAEYTLATFWGCYFLDYDESSSTVSSVRIRYGDIDYSLIKAVYEELDNIKMNIEPEMTDLEKALTVNDYMALNYEYDIVNYDNDTIPPESYAGWGIMTNKIGVCAGYTSAYRFVMHSLSVPCEYIISDSMDHAWNNIYLNGSWYHVDVTWNDPVDDSIGMARHFYFLFSDEGAEERHHYDWYGDITDIACKDTKYDDYFWKDINSRFIYLDGYLYYINNNSDNIYRRLGADGTEETFAEVSLNYSESFDYCNGKFYFCDGYSEYDYENKTRKYYGYISSYDVNTQKSENKVFGGDKNNISGFYFNGKNITCGVFEETRYEQTGRFTEKFTDVIFVRSVNISTPEEIYLGASADISYTVKPRYADNRQLKWTVNNKSIMTVTSNGRIRALREGIATVTASAADGSGVSVSNDVVVTQPSYVPVVSVNASVQEGAVLKNTAVALSTDTVGAKIYYTTDGSEPDKDSKLYIAPVVIDETMTIKAIAIKEGRRDSAVSAFEYKVIVSNSMIAAMNDYGYKVQENGDTSLDTMEFSINNTGEAQEADVILVIYDSSMVPVAVKLQEKTIESGTKNTVIFSDINVLCEKKDGYTAKVFIFGTEPFMFPLGIINSFSLS